MLADARNGGQGARRRSRSGGGQAVERAGDVLALARPPLIVEGGEQARQVDPGLLRVVIPEERAVQAAETVEGADRMEVVRVRQGLGSFARQPVSPFVP